MAIPMALLPEGTRVKVRRGQVPQDPSWTGRTGVVTAASEYHDQALGVVLDGESTVRFFQPAELEVITELALPPEREAAKRRSALP